MLKEYKNKYKGQRCFILGNGPSLLEHDLSLLKDELTFGCNFIFRRFTPTFLCISDAKKYEQNKEEMDRTPSIKFFSSPPCRNVAEDGYRIPLEFRKKRLDNVKEFQKNLEFTSWGRTVIIDLCLPIAYFMGFEKVYLIGCDLSDEGHFYDVRKLRTEIDRGLVQHSFKICKDIFEKDGRKIYYANKYGNIKVFEKVDYDSLF